ncbi:MAG: MBL fold metallo-hydrolase, partial [Candidatus Eremiobacteraeota bacterium]|nr:MBL fold metallo-hydrolase [Candidatus Eremiobacteraeota bacterium]
MILEYFPVGALQCNCVVVGDETTKKAVVVDPGDDVDRVRTVLNRHGLTVAAIVATHAHIDHVGGLAQMKHLTDAPVLLHQEDVPLYEIIAEQAEWLGVAPSPSVQLDGYLADGARISFGPAGLEVVHTPGHSPGSVCF